MQYDRTSCINSNGQLKYISYNLCQENTKIVIDKMDSLNDFMCRLY